MTRNPVTMRQLERAIRIALSKQHSYVAAFRSDPNPQVQEQYHKATGQVEAFSSILDAIDRRSTYMLEKVS